MGYWLLIGLSQAVRVLPLRAALALGAGIGWLWFHLVRVRRGVALANLRRAFPEESERNRRRTAAGCFRHLSQSAIELLRLPAFDRTEAVRLVEHIGLEHLEAACAHGRGVIAVTAHLGNFDLLACTEALRGVPLHIVTRSQRAGGVNRFWMKVRANCGLGLLAERDSALRIVRLLRAGAVVGMVIDQHMPPRRGLAVPFFGQPASTTHAPASLALATGAPLLPVSIERLPAGRHRVTIEQAMVLSREGDRQAQIAAITGQLNRWLEDRIRRRPDQWLWIHRRWKLGPATGGPDSG